MAHELHENDTMMSVKEVPWHKLGKVFAEAPKTTKEAIDQSGLGWDVFQKNIVTDTADITAFTGMRYNYRMIGDQEHVLGVVGNNTKILQNSEAFDFFDPFLESGLVGIETAGSLFNGGKVWILAKLEGQDEIIPGDMINRYLLLSNDHRGKASINVGFTPIRVVCNNTLTAAHNSKASKLIKVTHAGNIVENLESLRETIDLVNQQFIATAEHFKLLASKPINQDDLKKFVKVMFSQKKLEKDLNLEDDSEDERKSRVLDTIQGLFESGLGTDIPGVRGSAWGLYNAMSEYEQYVRGNAKTTAETRLNNIWFNPGDSLTKKSLNYLLAV